VISQSDPSASSLCSIVPLKQCTFVTSYVLSRNIMINHAEETFLSDLRLAIEKWNRISSEASL